MEFSHAKEQKGFFKNMNDVKTEQKKWKKILGKKKPKHDYEPQDLHLIKANQPYRDIKLKKDVLKGEVTVATKERAKQIIDAGLADELR